MNWRLALENNSYIATCEQISGTIGCPNPQTATSYKTNMHRCLCMLRNMLGGDGRVLFCLAGGHGFDSVGTPTKFYNTIPGPRGGLWACHVSTLDWSPKKNIPWNILFLVFPKIKFFLEIAVYWTFQIAITPSYGVGFSNHSWHRNQEDEIYPVAQVRHSFEHFKIWAIIKVLEQYLIIREGTRARSQEGKPLEVKNKSSQRKAIGRVLWK